MPVRNAAASGLTKASWKSSNESRATWAGREGSSPASCCCDLRLAAYSRTVRRANKSRQKIDAVEVSPGRADMIALQDNPMRTAFAPQIDQDQSLPNSRR